MSDTLIVFEGNPWDMQPGEPQDAYRAFCIYRDLPRGSRKMERVATLAGYASAHSMRRVARDNHWKARVEAYDAQLDAAFESVAEGESGLSVLRIVQIVAAYEQKIQEAIVALDPKDARWNDVARALDTLVSLRTGLLEGRKREDEGPSVTNVFQVTVPKPRHLADDPIEVKANDHSD